MTQGNFRDNLKATARLNKIKVADLLALTADYDPFYLGSPADHVKAKWARDLFHWVMEKWDDRRIQLRSMGVYGGTYPHLRSLHYLQTTGRPNPVRWDGSPYLGTPQDWKGFLDCFKKARVLAHDDVHTYIPFGLIMDRKHPPVTRFLERYFDGELVTPNEGILSNEYTFDDISFRIKNNLCDKLQAVQMEDNLLSLQERIPVHVEVWTEEKSSIIDAVAAEYFTNVQNAVGQQTYEPIYSLLQRTRYYSKGRPLRIIYISDYDPRGEFTMPVGVARLIEWMLANVPDFEGMDVKLKKIMLTKEQFEEYDLPPAPVKLKETMAQRWREVTGSDDICEIDSIETLFAPEMVTILREELGRYIPQSIVETYRHFNLEMEEKIQGYNDAVDDALTPILDRINDELRELTKPLLKDINGTIEVDVQDELDELLAFEEDFEEPDWPVDDGEDEWLYDSSRSYMDQIAYYKKLRG